MYQNLHYQEDKEGRRRKLPDQKINYPPVRIISIYLGLPVEALVWDELTRNFRVLVFENFCDDLEAGENLKIYINISLMSYFSSKM